MRALSLLFFASLFGCLPIEILQPACGGISGSSCEGGELCVDDERDTCDPTGGQDCIGVCVSGGQGCGNETDCGNDEFCDFNNINPRCAYDIECGTCTPEVEQPPVSCGGFVGDICAANEECVDDPSDDCDPDNGGADCIGFCEARATCFNSDGCTIDKFCDLTTPGQECDPLQDVECGSCAADPCTIHGAEQAACEADTANACALVECPPNADCAFICKHQ